MNASLICPICRPATLVPVTVVADLVVHQCPQCGGIWLNMNDYLTWLRNHPELPVTRTTNPISVTDITRLKACPKDGHAMRYYKVSPHADFTVDRCNTCHGVWFDNGEWEATLKLGMLNQIHNIFTDAWQRTIKDAAHRKTIEAVYAEKLGPDLYKDLRRLKSWLNKHPQKSLMLSYLLDENPYKQEYSQTKIVES